MRTPTSGSYTSTPTSYTYTTDVKWIKEIPTFSQQFSGSYGDTYFDIGMDMPVLVSTATNGTHAAWVWCPGTAFESGGDTGQTVTDVNLRFGYTTDANSPGSDGTSAYTIARRTRPDIYWDGSRYLVAYINASSVYVHQLNTGTKELNGSLANFSHGISNLAGASVHVISTSDVWISYMNGDVFSIQHWNGSTLEPAIKITGHIGLDWWHNTCARIRPIAGSDVLITYQHAPGMSASRTIVNGHISSAIPIMSADSDYAYQFVRVCNVTRYNNTWFAVVERGIYNSDDVITSWNTTLSYSSDGRIWSDWCGVDTLPIRGGLVVTGTDIGIITITQSYVSSTVRRIGNATWQSLQNVQSWSMNSGGRSMSNIMGVGVQGSITPVSAGDSIRADITIDGATFELGMHSVDRPAGTDHYSGKASRIQARGPLKYPLSYRAPVDEAFESGINKQLNMKSHSLVGKKGDWSSSEDGFYVNDDDNARAFAIYPESVPHDDMFVCARFDNWDQEVGILFFYEDTDTYWAFTADDTDYKLISRNGATENTLGTYSRNGSDVPYLMIHYKLGVLHLYVSTPVAITDNPLRIESSEWRLLGTYTVTDIPNLERFHIGLCGRVGLRSKHMYIRQGQHQFTVRDVCEHISGRCGSDLVVEPLVTSLPASWSTSGATNIYPTDVRTFDVNFDVDLTSGDISLALGLRDVTWGKGGVVVLIQSGYISYQELVYANHTDPGTETTVSRFEIPSLHTITNGDRIRVLALPSELGTSSTIQVYRNDILMCSFPVSGRIPSGYVGLKGSGQFRNLVVAGLSYPISTHVWRYNSTGAQQIRGLIQPFLYFEYEKSDNTIHVVPVSHNGGSLGNVDPTTEVVDHIPDDSTWGSIFKVVGAEVYGVFSDKRTITKGIRVVETDSPYLWTEQDCVNMASDHADLSHSVSNRRSLRMFFDPRIETFDRISIGGTTYIIDKYMVSVNGQRDANATMIVDARLEV